MPSLIKSSATETALRAALKAEGYRLSRIRGNGETGVDVLATRRGKSVHIEVIGFKSSGPARAKAFMQCFFRAVSRIKDGATRCVIALPSRWANGFPQRVKQYGRAWGRIGRAFPELEIWLVDARTRTYSPAKWNSWLMASRSNRAPPIKRLKVRRA